MMSLHVYRKLGPGVNMTETPRITTGVVGVADGNTTEHDNTTDYFTGTYHKVWLLSTRMDIAQISINPARLKSISLSKSRIHGRKNCHHHHYHVLQPSRFLGTHLKCQKCHSHIYISNLCNSKYVKCTCRPAGTSTDLSKERQHRYIPTYFHNVRIYSRKTKMQN
jgi:hypothetical protein